MKEALKWLVGGVGVLGAGLALVSVVWKAGSARELPQSVYVWQRSWNDKVTDAIRTAPQSLLGISPLAAEVRFTPGRKKAVVTRIRWDYAALQSGAIPVTAVVRIGDSGATTGWEPWACREIRGLATSLVEAARAEGLALSGFQVDYDCPGSKLEDYGKLLRSLRDDPVLGGLALSFTSLPSWLDTDGEEFRRLIRPCDYFVLQVHALGLPKRAGDPVIVMDPEQARSAVRSACRIGSPFLVALPTYSSFVAFDETAGRVLDVISEDLDFARLSPGQRLVLGEAPAGEIAALVSEWSEDPPGPELAGIIWYRLPVRGDVLNWPRETWEIVRSGRAPVSDLSLEWRKEAEGFHRILLRNKGELPESQLPPSLTLTLPASDQFVGADGGRWYGTEGPADRSVVFTLSPSPHDLVPLPVGRELPVGWVRKTGPGELRGEVEERP